MDKKDTENENKIDEMLETSEIKNEKQETSNKDEKHQEAESVSEKTEEKSAGKLRWKQAGSAGLEKIPVFSEIDS